MTDPNLWGIKLTTLFPSFVAAALAVLLEIKSHTWPTALLAIASGMFVAYVATEPVVAIFGWPPNASHAVAALFGISGRNLIMYAARAKTPREIFDFLRGKK